MRAKDKKDVYVLAPIKETVNGQTVVSECISLWLTLPEAQRI